ncbi:MAG: polysaccharide biosynthesis protein PslG [Gaiellales bacterium]|nr:polysaccharide biosynthesis protein PslG [Gaiellales bacterium]
MDALAHILLSLLALMGAGPGDAGPAALRDATTANPAGVPFAISDDAAQRAFPSELLAANAVGLSAARTYVDWSAIATQRPAEPRNPADPAYDWTALDADVARTRHSGLAVQLAFWRVPAWANGGLAPNAWPLNPQDLGDFAYAVALRYPRARLFYDWNEPNSRIFAAPNTVEAYEPMARAVYAAVHAANPGAQVAAGNLARYRDAGRDPAAWAAKLHVDGVPMDLFGIHPYPLRRAALAVRDPLDRIDLLDVPALARFAGVAVIVSEFGWSSDDVGLEQQAQWTAQAIEVARCTPGLAGFVFWGFHDHPVPAGVAADPWVRFGWLDATGQPKPVFQSALEALRIPLDCTAVGRAAGAPAGWPLTSTIPFPST